MAEATGYEAKTIHRLLEISGGVEDGDGYYFYMTMPNIAETNYNRNFTITAE